MAFTIAAFYRFVQLERFEELVQPIKEFAERHGILGTVLLAHEGINGTISGEDSESVERFFESLSAFEDLANLERKYSYSELRPFDRLKVRPKKEIVAMGKDCADPNEAVGTYVAPEDWNDLISKPGVRLVDCRNDYESEVGTFKGSELPNTFDFGEFPDWAKKNLTDKEEPIAMFCTGGIRCERSTAYLLSMGYKHVYHLKGGILKYLEDVPQDKTLWEGVCFVFDNRRAVDHDLQPTPEKVKWVEKSQEETVI